MTSRLPHATIFADASWCDKALVGGWGAWMIGRARPAMTYGGSLKGTIMGSTQAELLAMANALFVAHRAGYLATGATVMLQSDSTTALGFLRHQFGAEDRPMKDPAQGLPVSACDPKCWRRGREPMHARNRRAALLGIRGIVDRYELLLTVRHVRGHRNKAASEGDGRAWVNKECDRLAREGMLAARAKAVGGENV